MSFNLANPKDRTWLAAKPKPIKAKRARKMHLQYYDSDTALCGRMVPEAYIADDRDHATCQQCKNMWDFGVLT